MTAPQTDAVDVPQATLGRAAPSDVLDRLDLLAEAEAARFAPSLQVARHRSGRRAQVARLRDELLGRGSPSHEEACVRTSDESDDEEMLKWLLLAYPDRRRQTPRRGADRRDGRRPRRAARPGIGRP